MRMRFSVIGIVVSFIVTFAAGPMPVAFAANPGDALSRAEILRILLDAQEETRTRVERARAHLSKLPLFVDVDPGAWYAPYAEAAFTLRVTTGFPDRTLRAEAPVPVEEAITLLLRAYRQPVAARADGEEWFAPFVRSALQKNLVNDPRSLSVGQAITHGQFVDMVHRMSVVAQGNLATFPVTGLPIAASQESATVAQGPAAAAAAASPTSTSVISATPSVPTASAPVYAARASQDQNEIAQFASMKSFAVTIPSLGIRDLLVTHPEDARTNTGLLSVLRDGVGHLFGYPGRGGKIMIYGHSSGYAWDVSKYTKIFRQVNKLRPGDRVYVTFGGRLYVYSVTGQQAIAPTDARPFSGTGEELILYTCWPPDSTKSRLIVRAEPVERVVLK